jgi:TRAP-type C4-dicarboxylate transport system substrate-binding protein
MEQKRSVVSLVSVVFLAALLAFAVLNPTQVRAETFTLKAVTAWPKTATDDQAFFIFQKTLEQMVAKRAPSELKIRYIGGPEAVKTMDQVHAVQTGMVDMAYTANAYYVSLLPVVDAMKLSNMTPSEEREKGVWAYMNNLHEKIGFYYLARLGLGEKFYLYLTKPIKSADLTGLNIRVSPMYLQVIKGLGGNPVVIPPTDVYTALQRGVVDGYCWPAVGIRDWGWDKVTKYIVEPAFYQTPNMLLLNLKTWNKLPKKLQNIMTEAAIASEKEVMAYFAKLAKEERPILLKEGIKVIDLPPAEKEKFLRVAYDSAWKEIIEKNPKTGPEIKQLLTK